MRLSTLRRPQVWIAASLAVIIAVFVTVGVGKAGPWMASANSHGGHHDSKGSSGSYWNMPDAKFQKAFTAKTDKRRFYMGDSVTMPNGLQLQVLKVERNWQPPAVLNSGYPDGDNPAGREVILVWFKATDVGQSRIAYNDYFFTLKRVGMPEQRLALLSTLPGSSYGSYNKMPWLVPGEMTTTFIPFLVAPDEAPFSFQYYDYDSKDSLQPLRLSVSLDAETGSMGPSMGHNYTFVPDTDVTVR